MQLNCKSWAAGLGLCLAVCFFPAWASGQSEAMDNVRSSGERYLLSRISPSGACFDEPKDASASDYGLRTATIISTLLSLDINPNETPELRRAIKWLMQLKPDSTAPLAGRIMALCKLKDKTALAIAEKDVKKLVGFAYADGSFGPASANTQPGDRGNNQSTLLATLAFEAARQKNLDVPVETWRKLNACWISQQGPSGGFSWTKYRGNSKQLANPYGSMTAGGVVGMYLSYAALRIASLGDRENLDAANDRVITAGVIWIADNINFDFNPNKGSEWYYQWLEQLGLMSRLTGYRQLSGWWVQGRINVKLFGTQNADGSWGEGDRIMQTCRALNAIAKPGGPVFINKIRFPGRWNSHFDDARNTVHWLEYMYEQPMNWQVVNIDHSTEWDYTGRVCYLSGAGRMDFTDKQVSLLRDFIERGGILLSEAADGNGEFSLSVHRLYQKLFPKIRRQTLPADTPLLNLKFKLTKPAEMFGLSNGIRLLAVHIPHGISWQLEKNQFVRDKDTFEFFGNLLFYLYPNPGRDYRLPKSALPHGRRFIKTTFKLPRIKFEGNWNPEPYAMRFFDYFYETQTGQRFMAGDNFVTFEGLDASRFKAAVLSGTGEFPPLNDKEMLKVQQYLVDGGTIIADAAGSDERFIKSFNRNFMEKLGKPKPLPVPQAPEKIKASHQLSAIYIDRRAAVIFSPTDMQAGLVGYPLEGLISWDREAPVLLMNLLSQAGINTTKLSRKSKK